MFILKDLSKLPKSTHSYIKHLKTFKGDRVFPKRFVICAVFNENHAYYLTSIEKEQEAWNYFNKIITDLKEGKEVELVDYAGYQHPLKISYRGVHWLW